MIRPIQTLKKITKTTAIKWAVACAAVSAFAPLAGAQVHDIYGRRDNNDRRDNGRDVRNYRDNNRNDHNDRDHHDRNDVRFDIGYSNGPSYQYRTERIWVEPIFRTECDRVWVAPVYRTECEKVWVEPIYETRDVPGYRDGRRVIYRQQVLVRAGHFEERNRQVLVCDGHWDNVERQVLVSAGHWVERPVAVVSNRPAWSFNLGFFGR